MSIGSDELILYTDNDSRMYGMKKAHWLNLLKKKRKGVYEAEKGRKAFMHLANAGAKAYAKEHGRVSEWHRMFPMDDRREAAKHWEQQFRDMERNLELEWLLPEKLQKHRPGNPHPTKKKARPKKQLSAQDAAHRAKLARNAAKRRKHRCPIGTQIQTLIFPKLVYTSTQARLWARRHGYKSAKIDETADTFRMRQHPPGRYHKDSFRTISLGTVSAVIGCRR
jgi:hypothetical protein